MVANIPNLPGQRQDANPSRFWWEACPVIAAFAAMTKDVA